MLIWGGWNGTVYYNTGGLYDPGADTWAGTSIGVNVPSARRDHTAVWTGSTMIIWGGYDGTNNLSTGSIYDPSANSWAVTTTETATPIGRRDHTAVWTGSKMLIWGGRYAVPVNTGALYTP
jgi:N-acetylneuraminic acid mutarotase